MGHRLGWILVAVLVLGAGPAVAGKIGFVEVERAVASVDEGKAKLRELEEWSQPRQEQLQSLRDRALELEQSLSKQRTVATEEALKRIEDEHIEAQRRLEDAMLEYRRDLEVKQNEVLRDVARKLNIVVSDYAKANDYDAVLIFKDRTIIYLSETAELTETVIRLYNERFPAQREIVTELPE
jgi:Skp family chaperone for outer membrane proteins